MTKLLLGLALAVLAPASLRADYEIKCALYQGDPKGTPAGGTQKLVAAPNIVAKSGERTGLIVGGEVLIGDRFLPVGREIVITPAAVNGNAVRVRVVFKLHTLAGGGTDAPQVTTTSEETTATIQFGGTVRVEIGKDPKDRQWVDVTVRAAK
jgi:hypothetical protein